MRLEHTLVLSRYFLELLGVDGLDALKATLQHQQEGDDGGGHSFFYGALRGMGDQRRCPGPPRLAPSQLEAYDRRLMEYQAELARRRPGFALKYFQYLGLLFTEVYLDRLTSNPQRFLHELNDYVQHLRHHDPLPPDFARFDPDDLRRLAFFMATGSGKTLLLHINLWQIGHYLRHGQHPEALVRRDDRRRVFDNVLLITPNEGLSRQHLEELQRSGITAEPLTREGATAGLFGQPVRVIEIHKLAETASGDGVSIPLEQLGSANLVFVDEGHKGTGTEAQAWKGKQKRLSERGMLVEYSATFAQSIAAASARSREELRREYGKAILFDYSYRHFYHDGYGKDFFVMNVEGGRHDAAAHDVLAGGLMLFYQQRRLLRTHRGAYAPYQVETPLWVFLGTSVTASGEQARSDVAVVVDFLRRFLNDQGWAVQRIQNAMDGKSGFVEEGRDLLVPRLEPLLREYTDARALYEAITDDIFHGRGALEVNELKGAEGELGLRVSAPSGAQKPYFGVINIGDVSGFKKHLKEKLGLEVQEDHFEQGSLFACINTPGSPVNLLIGSKKFVEGWSSWRVACMGLLNIARSEGPQFLQLFGRGVRLKGRGWTLKRSAFLPGPHPDGLSELETLYILGWNANYIAAFRRMLEEEEVGTKLTLQVVPMQPWPEHLRVPRPKPEYAPGSRTWTLDAGGVPVVVDLTPTLTTITGGAKAEGAGGVRGYVGDRTQVDFNLARYRHLLDLDALHADLTAHKLRRGYDNVFIPRQALLPVLQSCTLFMHAEDVRHPSRVQEGAAQVLRAYLDRFVARAEREEHARYLEPVPLRADDGLLRPYTLDVHASVLKQIQAVLRDQKALLQDGGSPLPRLHMERHLFNPLLLSSADAGPTGVVASPTGLVKSEEDFVKHLRAFWRGNHHLPPYANWEVYLLRNLPRAGIGLFHGSGFYPDFLLWIEDRTRGTTRLLFVEPHGMGRQGAWAERGKAEALCKLAEVCRQPEFVAARMTMEGYILTETPLRDLLHGAHLSWEELRRDYHVYHQDDAGEYIRTLLNGPCDR